VSDDKRHAFPDDYEARDGISFPKSAAASDFSYSDGDAFENGLLDLLSKVTDRSLFSPEILAGIRDWPSRYHLSPKRANLLRPFASLLAKNVLEVGAGCGAVTRFLGENGGRVVAVEGSARRANIIQRRTSDLANVQVVCDRIEQFVPNERFDVVTAIGVLEYAARYSPDKADPYVGLLRCLRDLLAPNGVVFLAIENRLGLKYFAGAREDHTGAAFDGINDGYSQGTVATFGAAELARLLDRSGLRSRVWFLPCPDYKLPTTILSAPLLNRYPELAATLVAQATLADPQRPVDPTFSLEQGWSVLGRNALLGEMANSFLVVAGTTAEALAPYQHLNDLAWHYSVDRHPAFVKETRFVRSDNDLLVKRRSLSTVPQPDVPVRQVLKPELLQEGQNWWNELASILNKPNWTVAQVADWARVWTDALVRECGIEALNGETFVKHVDGRHFDLAPFNMVRDSSGETHFFDQEWSLKPTVELGYLVVRGLRDSLFRMTSCAPPAAHTPHNVNELVVGVLAELGILQTRPEIDRYTLMESQIQAWVQGRAAPTMSAEAAQAQWNSTLKLRAPAERDALVRERQTLQGHLEQIGQKLGQAEKARVQLAAELEQTRATADQQAGEIARLATLRDVDERRLAEVDRELHAARDLLRDSQEQMQRLAGELAGAQDELARRVSEHEAERAKLNAANEERDGRIGTLELYLREANARIQDGEARLHALAAERDAVLEQLAQNASAHEAERTRLNAMCEERDARIGALGLDLQAANARLQDSEIGLRALEANRDALQSELERKVGEFEAERARLNAVSEERDGRIADLELDLQTANARIRDSEASRDALVAERDAVRGEFERMAGEYEAERARLSSASEERDDRIADLELDLQAANARIQNSEASRHELIAERDTIRNDATRAVTERDAAARQMAQLFAEVGTLSALKPQLQAEAARAKQAEDAAAQLRADLEEERAARTRGEQERDAQAQDLLSLRQRLEEEAVRGRQIEEEAVKLRAALDTERAALILREQERDAQIHDLSSLKQRLEGEVAQSREIEQEVAQLRAALHAEQVALTRGEQERAAQARDLSSLKRRFESEAARGRQIEEAAVQLRAALEAERAAHTRHEQERDAQARDAEIARAHAEELRITLLRQAQEIEALAPKASRFSPSVILQRVAHPFVRWKRPDFRQKAWEVEVIRKSRLFSPLAYLKRYPDVAEAGEDPLLHYTLQGEAEGRVGHPLFDASFYLKQYPEVAQAKLTALAHYVSAGVAAGFDPNPLFDTDWYLKQNPGVAAAGINPLHHYMTEGWREGRDPHPQFDAAFYLANNPDVVAAGENPLVHYVYHGQAEGRPVRPSF